MDKKFTLYTHAILTHDDSTKLYVESGPVYASQEFPDGRFKAKCYTFESSSAEEVLYKAMTSLAMLLAYFKANTDGREYTIEESVALIESAVELVKQNIKHEKSI